MKGHGQPSLTAILNADMRAQHALGHDPPIYCDTLSVQLVPKYVRRQLEMQRPKQAQKTLDAVWLMAVIRYRVLADRLLEAHRRGVRQLVVLGAGLDTTAFLLPDWARSWRTIEVDHPDTQEWKRFRLSLLNWVVPENLRFAPCDLERDDLLDALGPAGFDPSAPAMLSWFGVVVYLSTQSTSATLDQLSRLAPGSEVLLTFTEPPETMDRISREIWLETRSIVEHASEPYVSFYTEAQMEALLRKAGFRETVRYPTEQLNQRYLEGRDDGLRLRSLERLIGAAV